MSAGKILLIVALVLTALRLALVCGGEIAPSEAYYDLCSKIPAAAYFDGPAGTAFLVGMTGLPDGVWRWQAPLWALAATFACFLLIRRVGDDRRAAWVALGLNALPVFNTEALRVGPSLPALTFALLALLFSWRAFDTQKRPLLWWLAAGVALGLATCLSYAVVILAPAMVLFTLCSARHRRAEDGFGLAVFLAVIALMLAPALFWNASQDWIPLAGGTFQTVWQFDFAGFFAVIAKLLAGFSPLVFPALLAAWVLALRRSRAHVRERFRFLCALPGVLLCLYFALRGEYAGFLLLLAAPLLLDELLTWISSRPHSRLLVWALFVPAIGFSLYGMVGAFRAGEGWKQAAGEVRDTFLQKSADGQEGLFLIAGDALLASVLGYHLRGDLIPPVGHPTVYVSESPDISNQFGLWPGYGDFVEAPTPADEFFTEQKGENPFMGRSALYISRESASDLPQTIKAAFESVTFLKQLPPAGGGSEPLYIYLCVNYQTLPL